MRYDNLQDYFNDAVAYFATMTRQCSDLDTGMYFDDEHDEHCIIGQFIPSKYFPLESDFNIRPVNELIEAYEDLIGYAIPDAPRGLSLATDLQEAHDASKNWRASGFIGWNQVAKIAEAYNLDFVKPQLQVDLTDQLVNS